MITLGTTIFVLLESLFSGNLAQRSSEVILEFSRVVVFAVFLGYHLANLRRDARAVTRTLAEKQANYPVLIASSADSTLGKELALAFSRYAPSIPIRYQEDEVELEKAIGSAKAVVIPSSTVTQSDSKWLPILAGYAGKVLSVAEIFRAMGVDPATRQADRDGEKCGHLCPKPVRGEADPGAEEYLRLGDPGIHPGGAAGADDHDDRAGDGVWGVVR